ncbi:hypothetical protein [Streptomyces galbus]
MRRHHVRRIPVVEYDGCAVGVVLRGDLAAEEARTRAWPTSTRAAPGHRAPAPHGTAAPGYPGGGRGARGRWAGCSRSGRAPCRCWAVRVTWRKNWLVQATNASQVRGIR